MREVSPIDRVPLGPRTIRFRKEDVDEFIKKAATSRH